MDIAGYKRLIYDIDETNSILTKAKNLEIPRYEAQVNDDINVLQDDMNNVKTEIQHYTLIRENKDQYGVFTKIIHKKQDGTVILTSVLSGGVAPQYTTKTITYSDMSIEVYNLIYDEDGVLISEVLV